jgi:glycosyltransferase involved in cell wall biosynthesis
VGERQPGLSVVIPVYNEADCLESLVAEVSEAVSSLGYPWELVLVDDGSDDDSPQRLAKVRGEQVRVVRLQRNCGQSTAILVGLRSSRYRFVATMDGDLQNDPRDLGRLLARLEQADMVVGARARRQDNLWRRAVSRLANRIRSRLTGDGISDTGCSLKVMTGQVADSIMFFQGAHRFLPALAQLEGFRVIEVPVSHRARTVGTTKYGSWQRLKATVPDLLGFLWLKSRYPHFQAQEMS